jgi:hypothetical protein
MSAFWAHGAIGDASILRVPGPGGRGAYVAEVSLGETVETSDFCESFDAAAHELRAILARRGAVLPAPPPPTLVYSAAWAAGELARQPGYDLREDPWRLAGLRRRLSNLLWAAMPEWGVEAIDAPGLRLRFVRPDGSRFVRSFSPLAALRAEAGRRLDEFAAEIAGPLS